jgi:hypothetical protein
MNVNAQRGFGAAEAAVICVVVIVIGLLGWKFMETQNNNDNNYNVSSAKSNKNKSDSANTVNSKVKPLAETDEKGEVVKAACSNPETPLPSEGVIKFSSQFVSVNGKYAHFSGYCSDKEVESIGGFHGFYIKENNSWQEVTAGVGDLDCDGLVARDFPQNFVSECRGPQI